VIETMGLDVEVAASRNDLKTHRPSILAQFLAEVGGFADVEGSSSLTAFLSYLDAAAEFERGLDVTSASTDNSVKVMTAHKAKGLEWRIVYVPVVCERVFPSSKGRPLWTSNAGVLPFELRGDAADFARVSDWRGNKGVETFRSAMKAHDEAEERRLAYVAMTRAEETLVVTGHWWGPTQQQVRGPSPYLSTVHDFCRAGNGQVWCWEPAPTESRNPMLAALSSTPWPVPLDPRQDAARRAGAQHVRDAMSVLARGEQISLPIDVPPKVREWDDDLTALMQEAQQRHTVPDSVKLPTTLSTSRAIQLVQSPEQFARQLVRPMPRPPVAAARRGTVFHAWVETLFGQRTLIDLDDLTGDDEEIEPNLETLQKAFLAGPFAERPPVAVEAPFQIVLADRVVSGRIDAVYQADERIPEARFEIVDWKTGSAKADPLQLAIYRLAWAELVGVAVDEVAAAFYYVAQNSVEYQRDLPGRPDLERLMRRATA
jgi:DNA helicase-2/ATP-dependent DNA helicase PcrA